MGLGVGLTNLPCKKIVEKPPRNSAGFWGGQGLSWAMEPRKEELNLRTMNCWKISNFVAIIIIIIIIIIALTGE
jgi:hypothetical protein